MQRRSSRLASSSGKTSPSDAAKTVSRSQAGSDKQRNDPKLRNDGDKSVQPKKKRQKVAQKSTSNAPGSFKNVRGRRGALKGIVEMPLDILHEIFMYLTSVEILHLSRTCKNLRRVLMTSSVEYIWKQARINLDDDFPECPEDLNEAQLAAFVFDGLCYYCGELDWREGFSNDEYHRICLESAINIYQEYMKIQPQDRDKWVKARHRERRRRMKDGEHLNEWLVQRSEDRSEHLRDVRERRYKA
ncbi:hypothetical protein H0H93_003247 [Arthromyces matolae]|nr:hypothetical protein H0H93_003247 [Arthromyces matolae]